MKSFWFGGFFPHRGIGVFFYKDYQILSKEYDISIEFVVPMKVRGDFNFYLFPVWAMAPISEVKGMTYTFQIEKVIKRYEDILKNNVAILIGDYNTPHIEEPVEKTEFMVVESFKKIEIFSAYHEYFKKGFGEHSHNTFYQHRKKDFKHMLDYCFASKSIIEKISEVEIGNYEDWIEFSDHCPLIIDIG